VSVVIVGVIRRKPVLTHASIVCEGVLASVNSVNSVNSDTIACDVALIFFVLRELRHVCLLPVFSLQNGDFAVVFSTG